MQERGIGQAILSPVDALSIKPLLSTILVRLGKALRDLLPIVLVIAVFQLLVLRQPFPQLGEVVFGGVLVVLGLMLFVEQH